MLSFLKIVAIFIFGVNLVEVSS